MSCEGLQPWLGKETVWGCVCLWCGELMFRRQTFNAWLCLYIVAFLIVWGTPQLQPAQWHCPPPLMCKCSN